MIDAAPVNNPVEDTGPRWLRWPLVRILVATGFVMLPFILLQIVLQKLPIDKQLMKVWPALLSAACCYAMYVLYVRRIERRPVAELVGSHAAGETGLGVVGGSLLFCATLGTLYLVGAYRVTTTAPWTVMIGPLFGMVVVGLLEEILFRGILFRILQGWLGSWIAVLISVVIFTLAHAPNQGVSAIALASVAGAGLLLCAAYMLTGRLWLGIGIHIGWNFTQGGLFSVPVSGQPAKGMIQGVLTGPNWLTGGAFGVEGSALAVVAVIAGSAALLAYVAKERIVAPPWKRRPVAE
ncbi:CPBP family intramembrane glutamic endopeptidase [Massilia psychrophila]|uniref:CPBP family intramembrane metalloprotease n=1 Tax=Massilia psychrophila TaxID=1603353 RepID=A0A2G8T6Y1_9BURK|nr:CPBP family intramembrane glutamic endopeptidase [Massilia psychrophila]PIL41723.1 CPBP family intramembrane metalloprotease [Massilia psychrophila]GGE60708.1 CAAX amino protease [Massilia psychrophila]